ncbi:MAG: urease accessory UreF family protein [Pseudohongiella sp.]|nr:urease accessory UreF family protein [Pseudohongiella sp.]MDO9521227.1 urease accessory UreF family protein [Pseudohongiella sp.]MDP2127316.1 urease accessory UreF family protein [Pseudohongiella sp.]
MNTTEHALLRLMHLSSPGLPVGAYAFSHGLEFAIDTGWLRTDEDVSHWLEMQLFFALARLDIPVLMRLHQAIQDNNVAQAQWWNDYVLASRETRELQLTDTATGLALQRLLPSLSVSSLISVPPLSFVTCYAQAAVSWQIGVDMAALGYCWAWLENQVNAATKLVPLGQTQAQKLLHTLQEKIPLAITQAKSLADDELGMSLPALSLASMYHETQYTRLFRS